jgi:hypothetical protein
MSLMPRMLCHELVEDQDCDTLVDTPETISGYRRRSSTGNNLAEWAEDLIQRLDSEPNEFARRITDNPSDGEFSLRDCRDCFRSWPRNPPSSEVRAKVLTRYGSLQRIALDWLTRGIYNNR